MFRSVNISNWKKTNPSLSSLPVPNICCCLQCCLQQCIWMLSVEGGLREFTLGSSSLYMKNCGYSNDLLFWVSHCQVNLKTQGRPPKSFGRRRFAVSHHPSAGLLLADVFAEHTMPIGEKSVFKKWFCENLAERVEFIFPKDYEVDLQPDSCLVKCGNRQCI